MAEFQAQAYICPVCYDDHSADKPHTFWPNELAAHDAGVWDAGWQKGYDFATRGQRTSDEVNPHQDLPRVVDTEEEASILTRARAEYRQQWGVDYVDTPAPDFRAGKDSRGHRPEVS